MCLQVTTLETEWKEYLGGGWKVSPEVEPLFPFPLKFVTKLRFLPPLPHSAYLPDFYRHCHLCSIKIQGQTQVRGQTPPRRAITFPVLLDDRPADVN